MWLQCHNEISLPLVPGWHCQVSLWALGMDVDVPASQGTHQLPREKLSWLLLLCCLVIRHQLGLVSGLQAVSSQGCQQRLFQVSLPSINYQGWQFQWRWSSSAHPAPACAAASPLCWALMDLQVLGCALPITGDLLGVCWVNSLFHEEDFGFFIIHHFWMYLVMESGRELLWMALLPPVPAQEA